ncbi:MAG: hypothetical protein HY909_01725 [Deltaproteobacteria bacterium]|nr:hypothetical protein [Deltaproteobacteria bacterium]
MLRSAWVALGFLLVGCPGSIDDPEPFRAARRAGVGVPDGAPPPDGGARCPPGPDVEREVFRARCAVSGCHDATARATGLDFESPGIGMRLRGAVGDFCEGYPMVVPSDPERSLLLRKVGPRPPCGDRMPQGLAALTDREYQCVRAWIAAGGQNPFGSDAGASDAPDAAQDAPRDAARDAPTDGGMDGR